MNQDAIFNRPFLFRSGGDVGVGGYLEANIESKNDNGVSNGIHFQARRLTLFLSGNPSDQIRFLTEIEFENGTEEINIEFAALDLIFSRSFTLRGGIILIPIGAFNQNHDGPKWNFVDRPLSATTVLPATWSAAGFGALGKFVGRNVSVSYELYATNGLDETIVSNAEQRTSLPSAKTNPARFEDSFNGHPMGSGRIALSNRALGEVGLSYAGGIYSLTATDGVSVGDDLWNHIAALDYSYGGFADFLSIRSEAAMVFTQLPSGIEPSYASLQFGGYADVNVRLFEGPILGFSNSAFFVAARGEYVDYHLSNGNSESSNADNIASVTLGIGFHPADGTIMRVNVRNTWTTDLVGNAAVRSTIFQFGITTYF